MKKRAIISRNVFSEAIIIGSIPEAGKLFSDVFTRGKEDYNKRMISNLPIVNKVNKFMLTEKLTNSSVTNLSITMTKVLEKQLEFSQN